MDGTDKTKPGTPAYIVKYQHRRIRKDYLKKKNAKLVWEETLKDKSKLTEYAQAMDILSREWKKSGDGLSRIEWAKSRTEQWFESGRREKMLRRWSFKDASIKFDEVGEDLRILDVGSCNGLFAEEIKKHNVTSIDIAPANENVKCADFASESVFDILEERSFDQVLLLYVLRPVGSNIYKVNVGNTIS